MCACACAFGSELIQVCLAGTNRPRHFLSLILVSISLAVVINCVQLANKRFPEDLFSIFSSSVSFLTATVELFSSPSGRARQCLGRTGRRREICTSSSMRERERDFPHLSLTLMGINNPHWLVLHSRMTGGDE